MKTGTMALQTRTRNHGSRGGFTLIELLIVCAIIAILASIAMSNFLEAQVRSKVSRVKADMRTMVTAVESYSIDNNNKYPIRHHRWEKLGAEELNGAETVAHHPPFTEKMYDPDISGVPAAVGLNVLTTPISYLGCVPPDIFNLPAKNAAQMAGGYFAYG